MPFHHSFHHCTKEPAVANGFVLRTAGYRVGDILKYLFGYDMMKKKRERKKKKIETEDKENWWKEVSKEGEKKEKINEKIKGNPKFFNDETTLTESSNKIN